jgi:tRNA-splicing ligase RtcB
MGDEPYTRTGQPVLIPGSMGTPSYVLVGGSRAEESLYSVNHGAGRVMSRSAALGRKGKDGQWREPGISDAEFNKAMEGIHLVCPKRNEIKEEAPQAYKDIDSVIHAVVGAGLAKVVARMRPLAVLKG